MTAPFVTATVKQPDWQKVITDIAATTEAKIPKVLDAIGSKVIAYLQSLTEEQRGWASITGDLARGYSYEVTQLGNGWRLTLANTVYYSIFLEARDGFFVLSGVNDPGGPVEQALVAAVAEVAPEFTVVVRYLHAAPRFRKR